MTKTTFLGYVPSLKSKHEATIVNGRAMKSKGGSIRYLLEGEYDGRKTLPKTVSKEDFVKVYGFDAKEAEAVIITGTKDGFRENKLFRVGKTKSDGFTPKLIEPIDKEAVEKIEKMADTVGSPSPADVEPPAPSEKPFPQEPSNENFSAEEKYDYITLKESGNKLIITLNEGADIEDLDEYEIFEDVQGNSMWRLGNASELGGLSEAPVIFEVGYEGDDDDDFYAVGTPYYYLNYQVSDWREKLLDEGEVIFEGIEVKEALGLFGKKEEKEEEPKTQEFTVVLQEGDKLELTDVEETEAAPDDENEEKEAETLEITDIDWETDDEDVDLPASVLVPSSIVEDEIADYLSDEYGFLVKGYVLNAETYEAVQAKVTRPVKEEKEESDEGLSTGAKVALGVGALAAGVALFGAEEDDYVPYESETDYSRIYEATSGEGYINHDRIDTEEQRLVDLRYDDPVSYYDWTSDEDVDEDDVKEAIKEELGDEPDKGTIGATVEVKNENDMYVDVDADIDTDYGDSRLMGLAAEEIGDSDYDDYLDGLEEDALVLYKDNPSQLFEKAYPIDYQVQMNDYESSLLADIQSGNTENSMMFDEDENLTPDGEKALKEMFDSLIDEALGIEWLASIHPPSELLKRGDPMAYRVGLSEYQDGFESETDGYTYAYTKGHKDGMKDEIVYRPSIDTDKEKTVFKKILKQKAESFDNDFSHVKTYDDYRKEFNRIKKEFGYDGEFMRFKIDQLHDYCSRNVKDMMADTVGSPSPSGPSSTPEPAEATGSEPSNENMKAEGSNMKLALGILGVGVGAVALLGGDRIKKIFDRFNL